MTYEEAWGDLQERLHGADQLIATLAFTELEGADDMEIARLLGKADGVRLALSYMRDYRSLVPVAS